MARSEAVGGGSPSPGHLLIAVDDDRSAAVVARLAKDGDTASFHAVLFRSDDDPLVLVEVAIPVTNPRWEFRSSGLWVEAVCERPGEHWSYGLEAFALAIDGADELLGRGYGLRTPLGWELDFVVDQTASGEPDDPDPDGGGGTTIESGRVDGLVLTGPGADGERAFAGVGWRVAWDEVDVGRWPSGVPAVGGQPREVALPLWGTGAEAGDGPVWWVGHDHERLTARWAASVGT